MTPRDIDIWSDTWADVRRIQQLSRGAGGDGVPVPLLALRMYRLDRHTVAWLEPTRSFLPVVGSAVALALTVIAPIVLILSLELMFEGTGAPCASKRMPAGTAGTRRPANATDLPFSGLE